MSSTRVAVAARPLDAAGWAPFGWLPVSDTDPADADHHLEFAWSDPNVNVIGHTYDEIDHTDAGVICDGMYRHDTHTQMLMVLDATAVIVVAPSGLDFSDPAHVDQIRAFRLAPQDCLVLARGTWHWGPYPIEHGTVRLLNVQGKRYAQDNTHVSFPETRGVVLEVQTGRRD